VEFEVAGEHGVALGHGGGVSFGRHPCSAIMSQCGGRLAAGRSCELSLNGLYHKGFCAWSARLGMSRVTADSAIDPGRAVSILENASQLHEFFAERPCLQPPSSSF